MDLNGFRFVVFQLCIYPTNTRVLPVLHPRRGTFSSQTHHTEKKKVHRRSGQGPFSPPRHRLNLLGVRGVRFDLLAQAADQLRRAVVTDAAFADFVLRPHGMNLIARINHLSFPDEKSIIVECWGSRKSDWAIPYRPRRIGDDIYRRLVDGSGDRRGAGFSRLLHQR
jgi:hypothetical protein